MKKGPFVNQLRRYVRIDTVLPVQFRILGTGGSNYLSGWLQGFTNNIGKGGICLNINALGQGLSRSNLDQDTRLSLEIETPITKKPVIAQAKIAWVQESPDEPKRYLLGLSYEKIDAFTNNSLMRYVWTKKIFVPVVTAVILILSLGLAFNFYLNMTLTKNNLALVERLIRVAQESNAAKEKISDIDRLKKDLESQIQVMQSRILAAEKERADLDKTLKIEEAASNEKLSILNAQIAKLNQERISLEESLASFQRKEQVVAKELLNLDQRKFVLEKANLEKMYKWLAIHQNPRTGLVMSFEGDSEISNWAFIYDQSLAAQAYIYFGDFGRAKKIMDFFAQKAQKNEGLFVNAYYANDGSPAEYAVHSGPNIWIGIAALHYTRKTQKREYLALAEEIAQRIMDLQNQDQSGGIRGGPGVAWYATEHNLDAYAFFNMLYQITGKEIHLKAKDKALDWLTKHTYDKLDIPIIRGKGDSTIATDTYAWSIAAIGPEELLKIGMNPDQIMEFAENNCAIEVSYSRPDGQVVKVRGFDFAPQRHVARGGVVSSEWSAQMIVSLRAMSDFYRKKGMIQEAAAYNNKAEQYLGELFNMVISSPSPSGQGEGCLPYASSEFVDTGHGWMTPKGKTTGSVAGTAYAIFAYYNYNPLRLDE